MDWKELEWKLEREPLPQRLSEDGEDLEKKILFQLTGEDSSWDKALEFLASSWTSVHGAGSLPVSLSGGILTVYCSSAAARQNLVLRFPQIQTLVQQRFDLKIEQMRFEKKAPDVRQAIQPVIGKSSETIPLKSDTVSSESSLILDIRRILGL